MSISRALVSCTVVAMLGSGLAGCSIGVGMETVQPASPAEVRVDALVGGPGAVTSGAAIDHRLLWEVALDARGTDGIDFVGASTVVLSTVDADRGAAFIAVDGDTGRTRWSVPRAGAAQTSEVVSTSPLWIRRVVAEGSELVHLDPTTGAVVRRLAFGPDAVVRSANGSVVVDCSGAAHVVHLGDATRRTTGLPMGAAILRADADAVWLADGEGARRISHDREDVVRPLAFTPRHGADLGDGGWVAVGAAADGTVHATVLDDDGTLRRSLALGEGDLVGLAASRGTVALTLAAAGSGRVVIIDATGKPRSVALGTTPLAAPLADEEGRWLVTSRGSTGDEVVVVVDGVAGTVLGSSPRPRGAVTADASRRGPQRGFAVAPGGSHAIAVAVAEGGRRVLQSWSLLGGRAGFEAVALD